MAERSKLDTFANIAIIIVCVIASVVLIRNFFLRQQGPPRPDEVKKGEQYEALASVVPAGADRALVLALSPGCGFCTQSMPFYKKLIDERNQKGSQVKVVAAVPAADAKEAEQKVLTDSGVQPDALVDLSFPDVKLAGTPTILLVDNQGKVLDVWVGKLQESGEKQVLRTL